MEKSEQKGPGFIAVVNQYDCNGTGECIKICPEKAIEEGPKRMPLACPCGVIPEMRPGMAVIIADKCTGCGECVAVCPNKAITMVHIN